MVLEGRHQGLNSTGIISENPLKDKRQTEVELSLVRAFLERGVYREQEINMVSSY